MFTLSLITLVNRHQLDRQRTGAKLIRSANIHYYSLDAWPTGRMRIRKAAETVGSWDECTTVRYDESCSMLMIRSHRSPVSNDLKILSLQNCLPHIYSICSRCRPLLQHEASTASKNGKLTNPRQPNQPVIDNNY